MNFFYEVYVTILLKFLLIELIKYCFSVKFKEISMSCRFFREAIDKLV